MIYGSQDSAVTFPGIQGSSNGDGGRLWWEMGWWGQREEGEGGGGQEREARKDKSSNSLPPLNQSTSRWRKSWSTEGSSSSLS